MPKTLRELTQANESLREEIKALETMNAELRRKLTVLRGRCSAL